MDELADIDRRDSFYNTYSLSKTRHRHAKSSVGPSSPLQYISHNKAAPYASLEDTYDDVPVEQGRSASSIRSCQLSPVVHDVELDEMLLDDDIDVDLGLELASSGSIPYSPSFRSAGFSPLPPSPIARDSSAESSTSSSPHRNQTAETSEDGSELSLSTGGTRRRHKPIIDEIAVLNRYNRSLRKSVKLMRAGILRARKACRLDDQDRKMLAAEVEKGCAVARFLLPVRKNSDKSAWVNRPMGRLLDDPLAYFLVHVSAFMLDYDAWAARSTTATKSYKDQVRDKLADLIEHVDIVSDLLTWAIKAASASSAKAVDTLWKGRKKAMPNTVFWREAAKISRGSVDAVP